VTADSPGGALFARYSSDPRDVAVFEHEAAVRRIIGSGGALRTPPVLDAGRAWLLELRKEAGAVKGADAVDAVVAAAAELPRHDLPQADGGSGRAAGMLLAARRRARVAVSRLRLRDVARARRIIEGTDLPLVTSHGDFHVENILVSESAAWIVDWELAGRRPAGYDLMQLWATLPEASERERLWQGALRVVGVEHERALRELRYALVVRTIANKLAAPQRFHDDREGAERLLALLPELRRASAGLGA
jgi:hypothetical protein